MFRRASVAMSPHCRKIIVTNCELAFAILSSSIVAFALALVLAAVLPQKKPRKKRDGR